MGGTGTPLGERTLLCVSMDKILMQLGVTVRKEKISLKLKRIPVAEFSTFAYVVNMRDGRVVEKTQECFLRKRWEEFLKYWIS